jgi:hypothetical protein
MLVNRSKGKNAPLKSLLTRRADSLFGRKTKLREEVNAINRIHALVV